MQKIEGEFLLIVLGYNFRKMVDRLANASQMVSKSQYSAHNIISCST